MEIRTERLLIREWREGDADAAQEYASDPEVVRYMPWGPNTLEQTSEFVRKAIEWACEEPRTRWEMAVEFIPEHRLIGGVGLSIDRPEQAHLGYCLHRAYWRRGIMTEAVRAMFDFGFRLQKLHRIFATCDPLNTGSFRVMEKAGMRREGLMRQQMRLREGWRDSYLYAILGEEWRKE